MILALLLSLVGLASAAPGSTFSAQNIQTLKPFEFSLGNKKAAVLVFLSAECPCSNSHVTEIKELVQAYPEFEFVGVHSNLEEGLEKSQSYFKEKNLNFTVVQDDHQVLAKKFNAFKTPHAYILDRDGKILYQGGVTDSEKFQTSKRKWLREALEDLKNSRPIKEAKTRTLGCSIVRE